ncbi:MAG: exodeoxyribonuclease VII small subunit [Gammaproteobacteria bacterium]|nr:exodeoxyribonuclease VII small subunit [Gammaproteobacteria bacterium]
MPAKKSKKTGNMDFEKAMEELESLVDKMESGDLSLEDSLKHFEQGVKLTRQCQIALKDAEQKVSILLSEDNKIKLTDFDN